MALSVAAHAPRTAALSPTQEAQQGRRGQPQQQVVVASDGRIRRRAVFGADVAAAAGDDSSDDEEDSEEEGLEEGEPSSSDDDDGEEEEEEEEAGERQRRGAGGLAASQPDEDGEAGATADSDDESEGLGGAAAWKARMLQRAAALFSTRGADLHAYIYGVRATADVSAPGRGGRCCHAASAAWLHPGWPAAPAFCWTLRPPAGPLPRSAPGLRPPL
jgi:hypothetical protein